MSRKRAIESQGSFRLSLLQHFAHDMSLCIDVSLTFGLESLKLQPLQCFSLEY